MHNLLREHGRHIGGLPPREQAAVIVNLADFLLAKRQQREGDLLLGPGRHVLTLFRARDHFESRYAKLVRAFGGELEFLRADPDGLPQEVKESFERGGAPEEVKRTFLRRVRELVRDGKPATIVVWAHGLPDRFEVADGLSITPR